MATSTAASSPTGWIGSGGLGGVTWNCRSGTALRGGDLEEAEQAIPFTDDLRDRVEALSRRERVTPFMTMLAAFEVLLFHYTGVGIS